MTARSAGAPAERTKVAILGGGCGGLAAAWRLTETAELRERFDVTVYQLGWRLGGKGASGRAAPDPIVGRRIYEHGLHIWFGFYARAFAMVRGAYAEAGLATGDDWWKRAFERCDAVSLYEQRDDGEWLRHSVSFPRRGGADRGPPAAVARPPLSRVLARTTRLLAAGLRNERGRGGARRGTPAGETLDEPALDGALATLDRIASEIDQVESPFDLGADRPARHRIRGVVSRTPSPSAEAHGAVAIERLTGALLDRVHELRAEIERPGLSDRMRLWGGVLELVAASLAGIIADDVLWRGFSPLDDEDLREWFKRHGAADETVTRSPVLRGLYDLTFAYRGGDKRRPSLAAGKGLQSLLMMINYEGSFMWRMRAGMGESVFSPLYLALARRGVRFRFFSRITGLRVAPGRPEIAAIEYLQERAVDAGDANYEPLERVGDWWCWAETPHEGQLRSGPPQPRALIRGADFDEVVLAIPVGAQAEICSELSDASPRFRQMLTGVETVATKAMQLWLSRPISDLTGSDAGPLDHPATAYAEPFDTYCDMSHLIEAEGSDVERGPRGVAYFCAVLPDEVPAERAASFARAEAVRHLERAAAAFWPGASRNGEFDWSILFDPDDRRGHERIEAQYVRANVSSSDRYVTTPAGSVDARLEPEESGFENLVLAGDWTHSGIDGGCVEAAVISGERAAAALVERRRSRSAVRSRGRYVEYGALATAPGPLLCERARLYCFVVRADRARVQQLCDRVLREPTGGALRYHVPRLPPVILSFGTIAGLRSLHPDHAGRGSASEPEAAIWVPTVAQRLVNGRYEDQRIAIFMPYIWVDDPIAFASGREVYGFPKTQGWTRRLADPRPVAGVAGSELPDPPDELTLDVYGAIEYGDATELQRTRLMTVHRRAARRGGPREAQTEGPRHGSDLGSLVTEILSELEPSRGHDLDAAVVRRSIGRGMRSTRKVVAELLSDQSVAQVFLKQVRDAQQGELAALQQIVEARSTVTAGTFRWRRLRGTFDLSIASLASHPLEQELGLALEQSIRLAFVAEFGFRMDAGVVRWPDG